MAVLYGDDAFTTLVLSNKTLLQFSEKDFRFPEILFQM